MKKSNLRSIAVELEKVQRDVQRGGLDKTNATKAGAILYICALALSLDLPISSLRKALEVSKALAQDDL